MRWLVPERSWEDLDEYKVLSIILNRHCVAHMIIRCISISGEYA